MYQGGQKTAGLPVQIWQCNGSGAQTWNLNSDGHLFVLKVLGLRQSAAEGMVFLYGFTSKLNSGTQNCTTAQRGLVVEQVPSQGQYVIPQLNVVTMALCDRP